MKKQVKFVNMGLLGRDSKFDIAAGRVKKELTSLFWLVGSRMDEKRWPT